MTKYFALDRIDRSILRVLQSDGRITNADLADAVALSPSACLARVRRLEKEGVITGYKAQIDAARIDSNLTIFALMTLSKHDSKTSQKVERIMRGMPEVIEAFYTSGTTDYIARFIVPDMAYWSRLQESLLDNEELKIETIVSHFVMRDAKSYSGVPLYGDSIKEDKRTLPP
ncbi:Lrp/AsnC family transcriptional regulator [Hyphomonas jannaschiana]|uniref:AsnC family transcriptional regulator n=1 Tax=Hyphomonas jannaschiana VP2 TaxID=1280952 RepID=A0A059FIC0_9PROT|nr:Lrp/AsnC family transcriptional regulator [Hyphomonas jannaschiana]KCZ90357.1 AsnC family transcriptional regulator [Hyphomonas jannaschiana VP2]